MLTRSARWSRQTTYFPRSLPRCRGCWPRGWPSGGIPPTTRAGLGGHRGPAVGQRRQASAAALPRRSPRASTPDDDAEEYAAMARWADQTCGGVACAQRLAGNVGYLDLQPALFPSVMSGEIIAGAMSMLAVTDALVIDLRQCRGGGPARPRCSSAICGTTSRCSSPVCRNARTTCSGRPGHCRTCLAAASARTSRYTC